MGFSLTSQFTYEITQVPDIFIDEYMPHANGSFVKVYLFLLRQMHSNKPALTIETMADMLSNTEADILRALRYWEKQGILSLTETDGKITNICLLPFGKENSSGTATITTEVAVALEETPATRNQSTSVQVSTPTPEPVKSTNIDLPEQHYYSPLQAEALMKDPEIESCLSMVQALLGTTGTTTGEEHMQLVLYLMSDLGFSSDLVITSYETAISRGSSKPRYIKSIAVDWAKKGIMTPEEAKEEASSFNGIYKVVASALGLKLPLAAKQKKIVDKWEKDFHFPASIIEEACGRTVLQTGEKSFSYTSSILEDWHKKGVTSLKDIEDCDKSYFRQKTVPSATQKRNTSVARNKFQNFPQRDYSQTDYADLERQLLHQ